MMRSSDCSRSIKFWFDRSMVIVDSLGVVTLPVPSTGAAEKSSGMLMDSLGELFEELKEFDLLVKHRPDLDIVGAAGTPHTAKFNSGVIALRPNETTFEFVREYDRRTQAWISAGKPVDRWHDSPRLYTCIDQEFLFPQLKDHLEVIQFRDIPL